MDDQFDPYLDWFGLSPAEGHPPDHYALLGIDRFENDREKIYHGADLRMELLKQYQNGVHAKDSQLMLTEVSMARVCLTNAQQRATYDKELRERIDINSLPNLPVPPEIFPAQQLANQDPLAGTYSVQPRLLIQPRDQISQKQERQKLIPAIPYCVWLSIVGIASVVVAGYGIYSAVAGRK